MDIINNNNRFINMTTLKSKYTYEHCYNKYNDFEKNINPLDTILFDTTNKYKCKNLFTTKKNTQLKWQHAALVIPNNFIKFNYTNNYDIYIIESTNTFQKNISRIESNNLKNGLQIRKLKDVAESHIKQGGTVIALKLTDNPFYLTINQEINLNYKETQIYINSRLSEKYKLNDFWKSYTTKINSSQNNIIDFFKSYKKRKKKYFCSEVVIKLYQHLDIINNNNIPKIIRPGEITKYCINNENQLIFDRFNVKVLTK